MMITVGVDLATLPAKTAIASIEWTPGGARLVSVTIPASDDAMIEAIRSSHKAGLDCPLGWPTSFIEFVSSHAIGDTPLRPNNMTPLQWRNFLAFRRTDIVVQATGARPLSVATQLLGLTAIRASEVLARLAALGEPVQRDGSGTVVEVYPAGSLRAWGLVSSGYKSGSALSVAVTSLQAAAPWLDMAGHEQLLRSSDHAFDAVISALSARAAAQGRTTPLSTSDRDAAAKEGWIALPTSGIETLV